MRLASIFVLFGLLYINPVGALWFTVGWLMGVLPPIVKAWTDGDTNI